MPKKKDNYPKIKDKKDYFPKQPKTKKDEETKTSKEEKPISKLDTNIIFIMIFFFIAIIITICYVISTNTNKSNTKDIYLITKINNYRYNTDKEELITNEKEYINFFNKNPNINLDFNNYNYLAFVVSYDNCSEENLKVKEINYNNDKVIVTFSYKAKCGVCAPDYYYYLVKVPKKMNNAKIELKYHQTNNPNCPRDVAYKPLIYLYPENTTKISVKLGNPNNLTVTYPEYNNGWEILAKKDGTLINLETNRQYYGLYWEGKNYQPSASEEGFVIKGSDTVKFLEEKLKILGLTDKEAAEFIIYWLPKMQESPYNYIYFEEIDHINEYMPITVEPKPDTIIRIMMVYKPLKNKINVKPQKLVTPERKGFTVVEWGGTIKES